MTITRPRVIVVYDGGAFAPWELAEAAHGVCEIVWLTGWPGAQEASPARLLRRLGTHIDASGHDLERIAGRLREESADGIAAFSDAAIQPAAALAHACGLVFHNEQTARRLRDKFAQRAALARAGLRTPGVLALSRRDVRSREQAAALPARWPAVLKPRRGTASRDTFLLDGPADLVQAMESVSPDTEFVLEDYLADRPPSAGRPAAGLFSVELLVDGEVIEPIVVTGRFALQPPLRESGSYLPSDIGPEDAAAAVDTARRAATALGVDHGILHVEQKLTPEGPVIVEVNGRVGGLVPTLLRQIGGAPILTWAFRIALGLDVGPVGALPASAPVAFYRAWLPPVGTFRLHAISGFDELTAHPRVEQAWLQMQAGEVVSSREGGGVVGYAAAVFGSAPDHASLWPLVAELDATLSMEFEPAAASCRSPSTGDLRR